MEWHQPWLLQLTEGELEELYADCRSLSREHRRHGRFGLAFAWNGLAHETIERAMELQRENPGPVVPGQMSILGVGAYGDEIPSALELLHEQEERERGR